MQSVSSRYSSDDLDEADFDRFDPSWKRIANAIQHQIFGDRDLAHVGLLQTDMIVAGL